MCISLPCHLRIVLLEFSSRAGVLRDKDINLQAKKIVIVHAGSCGVS